MKRTVIALAVAIAAVAAMNQTAAAQGSRAQKAQDFNTLYAQTEIAYKAGEKVYNGPVRPVWTSEDTFYFQTREAGGDVWYKVTGAEKTSVDKETFEEAVKSVRRNRYYDPSDDSQYAVR
ncbi:MAG: hypothetical protein SPK80_09765, partial [Bacteroidales bacterium]|nr:hypothetical protein [Bacteroidales bacterium]